MRDSAERFLFSQENFLIVARGLFPPKVLKQLRTRIAARRASIQADDERSRKGEEVGVAPDELRLNEDWYDIWRHADQRQFREYAPSFSEVIFPPQIRVVRNARAMVPWHQDSMYMQALGKRGHAEVITCFVPLDDDSENRSTLQFAVNPLQKPVRALRRPDADFNQFDVPEPEHPAADQCRTFRLSLGDAFVFGQHVLHRTYAESSAFAERSSMEFRLTTARAVVAGKDYFSLDRLSFYRAALR